MAYVSRVTLGAGEVADRRDAWLRGEWPVRSIEGAWREDRGATGEAPMVGRANCGRGSHGRALDRGALAKAVGRMARGSKRGPVGSIAGAGDGEVVELA
jgi:hypothetical protein